MRPHLDSQDKPDQASAIEGASNQDAGDASLTQQNDLAMDILMNHVNDYNKQHLKTENNAAACSRESAMSSDDLGHYEMNEQQLLALQQASTQTLNVQSSSSMPSGKSKAKKESSGQHSSLLNAFANPLLHAIPVLARNCINFQDFLAQAALHGENGIPGTRDKKSAGDFSAIEKALMEDKSMMLNIQSPWRIRVAGLPATGAKSRVETQIKLCIQLVNTNGDLSTDWTHLKLPDYMISKDKLRHKQPNTAASTNAIRDESKTLQLEAGVVCDSHPDNEIIMCTSCVHRERKRMKRKRDNKAARAANKESSAAKLAALYATELPDLSDENVMADERRRILVFNCPEYVEFHNGETTLPTRVTCYCRHHSEKVGFRIVFTVKDSYNHVVATGRSPPIMITDDHKSVKPQTAPAAPTAPTTAATAAGGTRKRMRAEYDTQTPGPESSSKKKTSNGGGRGKGDVDTDSGISSPMGSAPQTPNSQSEDSTNSPVATNDMFAGLDAMAYNDETMAGSSQLAEARTMGLNHERPLDTGSQSFLSHMQDSSSFDMPGSQLLNQELYGFLPAEDIQMNQLLTQPTVLTTQPQQEQSQFGMAATSSEYPPSRTHHTQQNILSAQQLQAALMRKRAACTAEQQFQASNVYAKMQRQVTESGPHRSTPKLHRLIPSEGPVYGGAEVAVLGSNFYEGLTCMFGNNPAIPTHCWSSNTLLCILPPAATAGPVVVSFKEHPLMQEGQDVVMFTYFDESDRALMELALQVVGLKTIGKVEDARKIAMRIVQGDAGNRKGQYSAAPPARGVRAEYRQKMTVLAATAVYENARALILHQLEQQVIATLSAVTRLNTQYHLNISLTNSNQHTLLHLATLCGYDKLVRTLVKLGCDVNYADHNGFTALHFASWTGKQDIVRALIHKANLETRNIMGKTAERLAQEAGHDGVVALLKQAPHYPRPKKRQDASTIRRPLADFIPTKDVATVKALLPVQISDLLSNIYTFSANTRCAKSLIHSVGQVYQFMLDPF